MFAELQKMKLRIMIAENDFQSATDLGSRLKRLGYDLCASIDSSDKAVERAEEDRPDLILMAVTLSGKIGGIEAAELIHARTRIPVVFVTAYADLAGFKQTMIGLPFSYILKPFKDRDLEVAIEIALYIAHADAERRTAEEALRESEERHRTFIENTPIGVYSFTPGADGNYIVANPAFLKMFGFESYQELESSRPAELFVTYQEHKEFSDNLLALGSVVVEHTLKKKDGTPIWGSITARVARGEKGEVLYFDCAIEDITSRKLAEKAIQESEAKYRAIVEDQTELVSRFLPNGTLTFVNGAYCRYFGETQTDLVGREFMHHLPRKDQDNFSKYLSTFSEQNPIATIEHRVIDHKGEIRWQQWTDRAIFNEKGEIVEFQAVGRDITERMKAEEALRNSERQFRSLFDTMSELVVLHELIYDSSGQPFNYRILDCNPAFTAVTGIPHERAVGALATSLYESDEAPYLDIYSRVTQTGKSEHFETFYAPMNKHFRISVFSPAPGHFATVTSDVTERKQAEAERGRLEAQMRQLQKLEAVGTLAGGIAHDFNNILGIISGYTQLAMMDTAKEADKTNHLMQVVRAVRRAKDLVKQILAFSRQTDQELKPVQVKFIVKETLRLLRAVLPTTIEVRGDIQSNSLVFADPTQVHQLLMNLCTNAGHAMHEQGGILGVGLTDVEFGAHNLARPAGLSPGSYIRLTVSDTGQGMDRTVLDRIFDPYFTTKGPGEGTGLGLAVVHGIVRSYGGAITAHSEPGQGSCFHVYLPKMEGEMVEQKREIQPLPRGSETILFVDDEADLVDVGSKMLESLGYRVVARTCSFEALQDFRTEPEKFDLVFTDMTMPQMTGLQLAKELSNLCPVIPIILCTGFSQIVTPENIEAASIRRLLMKPLVLNDVAKIIREVLDGQQ